MTELVVVDLPDAFVRQIGARTGRIPRVARIDELGAVIDDSTLAVVGAPDGRFEGASVVGAVGAPEVGDSEGYLVGYFVGCGRCECGLCECGRCECGLCECGLCECGLWS